MSKNDDLATRKSKSLFTAAWSVTHVLLFSRCIAIGNACYAEIFSVKCPLDEVIRPYQLIQMNNANIKRKSARNCEFLTLKPM